MLSTDPPDNNLELIKPKLLNHSLLVLHLLKNKKHFNKSQAKR
jgi:hypothetical protein